LTENSTFEHSTGDQRPGCGENLAMNSQTEKLKTTSVATDMWYGELHEPGYNFDTPGWNSNPGTGHFT